MTFAAPRAEALKPRRPSRPAYQRGAAYCSVIDVLPQCELVQHNRGNAHDCGHNNFQLPFLCSSRSLLFGADETFFGMHLSTRDQGRAEPSAIERTLSNCRTNRLSLMTASF
jgi:hypothetical protein